MRTLKRNQTPIWYAQYRGKQELVDSDGNYTGEQVALYTTPQMMMANVSPTTGQSYAESFGYLKDYDRVVVTDWMECPIDENTVLWYDREPEDMPVEGGTPGETVKSSEGFNYIVRRVAKSLNSIAIAISRVDVSPVPTTQEQDTEGS